MVTKLLVLFSAFLYLDLNIVSGNTLDNIQDILRSTITAQQKIQHGQANKFQYNNCGHPATDVFNLTSFSVSPDPIKLPGIVSIAASMKFRVTGRSPIKLQVDYYKKLGESWLKIPCIAEIGSCTYEDICDILNLIPVCPPQLVDAGIPCKCPFAQGTYKLPKSDFPIPLPLLPNGDYRIKAVFTNGQTPGACIELFFSIA